MFSQVSVCRQSASWILVQCTILLQRGRYASLLECCLVSIKVIQECIPVGCVLSTSVNVATGRGVSLGLWGSLPLSPGGGSASRLGGCQPLRESTSQPPLPTPPVNRMTDRCKNITLPQTSFACVKNTSLANFYVLWENSNGQVAECLVMYQHTDCSSLHI